MQDQQMSAPNYYDRAATGVDIAQSAFVTKVYRWMSIGLILTAVVALLTANTPSMVRAIFGNRAVFLGLLIGELVLVVALSAMIGKISAGAATAMFIAYSALNGLTLAVVFLAYTKASIASTFFCTAGMFGALALYGHFTKRNLTSIGHICGMALFGLIIASVVNLFVANSALYWLITYGGIVIFVGLTAYDAQMIRQTGLAVLEDPRLAQKAAIMCALRVYLDFIMLFILLLRLMGKRR